jgi:hypothetical protein
MPRLSIEAERALVAARIERKRAARQSIAADQALLIRLTNKQIRAEVRARKRKAA